MSELRSRVSSGPSRFIGGAEISTKRTCPSLLTFSFSKTMKSFWLLSSIGFNTVVLLVGCLRCLSICACLLDSEHSSWLDAQFLHPCNQSGPFQTHTSRGAIWTANSAIGVSEHPNDCGLFVESGFCP